MSIWFRFSIFMLILLPVFLSGCANAPAVRYALGATLLQEDFTDPASWETYVNTDQRVAFEVIDGAYRARAWDNALMWTLNDVRHEDVVIEVETTQRSDYRDNAYGLMCRASPTNNGNGYYFLISGDGHYTIRRGAADEIDALIPWRPSAAIQQDKAINRIRIVCIGEVLALYVNGEFVAETNDGRYRNGYAGLSAAVTDGEVEIWFDDLSIWEALRSD